MKFPSKILDESRAPFYRWFVDGQLNICESCVDRHAKSHPTRRALVWVSKMVEKEKVISYGELLELVCKMSLLMRNAGVGKGDRVIIFMPMLPLAVVCMLAAARIGAVHSLVFGGFAARELASRIQDSRAKLLLTSSCGI
jgi:propionyl-CoA synthetase